MRRISKNPRYSLRAFAKSLDVSHTALSLVMAGKRPASKNLIARLADNVGMAPPEKDRLLGTVRPRRALVPKYQQMDLDLFELIADWNHYAILSLLDLPGGKFEAKWIAARLSIPQMKARAAMNRLERLGLVGSVDGRFRQVSAPLKIENSVSTPATRQFHRQILAKARESLDEDPMELRDFSAMTFAMDESLVPLARERIRNFRRKLMAELESKGTPTHVYNLAVQIYPGSKS